MTGAFTAPAVALRHATPPTKHTNPSGAAGDAYTNFNRRIDMSMAKLPYGYYEARTEIFRKRGVRTAYTKDLMPIMYRANHYETGPAPDFRRFATAWELKHSQIVLGEGPRSVFPVVDETGLVVAHYGKFDHDQVFLPGHIPSTMEETVSSGRVQVTKQVPVTLEAILRAEFEVFAHQYDAQSYRTRGYRVFPRPQMTFTLVTDIDGKVLMVVDSRSTAGGVEAVAYSPLDLIFIARSALALAGRLLVRTLARKKAANLAQTARRQLGVGAAGGDEAVRIPVQARQVTQADMIAWEREGGHIIQNHGPQLTREKLKERVLGHERNIPMPQNRPRIDGKQPKDFRVWRGKEEGSAAKPAAAASAWESDETMRRAIGEIINRNLEQIRRTTKNGGSIALENQPVGYRTGAGWVSSHKKKAEAGMFWMDDLDGITIVIRPRKNHVPTANDPEGWYVLTAFPDVAM
jgi:hypothetical protein